MLVNALRAISLFGVSCVFDQLSLRDTMDCWRWNPGVSNPALKGRATIKCRSAANRNAVSCGAANRIGVSRGARFDVSRGFQPRKRCAQHPPRRGATRECSRGGFAMFAHQLSLRDTINCWGVKRVSLNCTVPLPTPPSKPRHGQKDGQSKRPDPLAASHVVVSIGMGDG